MKTLSTELSVWLDRRSGGPARIYADANVPAGLVTFMRQDLHWDVFWVMEHADLRRAADTEHYRLARQMHRTLLTLDRDYLNDRRFPPQESGGVVVASAPDEQQLARLMRRLDRTELRPPGDQHDAAPLTGRKIVVHPEIPSGTVGRRRRRRP